MGDISYALRDRRWSMRKVLRGTEDRRDARCRTRTAKPSNSNSFIGMNNRFGLPREQAKNFIIISKRSERGRVRRSAALLSASQLSQRPWRHDNIKENRVRRGV
jgi:hypothetical protein